MVAGNGWTTDRFNRSRPWSFLATRRYRKPYASEKAQITWIDSSGQQELLQIPFWRLVQHAWIGAPILNKNVNFRMKGSPSGYPSYRWIISLDAVIRWPNFVEKPVVSGLESPYESDLVITTSGISAFHPHEDVGKLELSRPLTTQILLYSVILAPLLLAFAAAVSSLKPLAVSKHPWSWLRPSFLYSPSGLSWCPPNSPGSRGSITCLQRRQLRLLVPLPYLWPSGLHRPKLTDRRQTRKLSARSPER